MSIQLPWKMLLGIVVAIVLLAVLVTMHENIWNFMRAQGKAILVGINELMAGNRLG